MNSVDALTVFQQSREQGWVLEPATLQILKAEGMNVVEHRLVRSLDEARESAAEIGYPLVAKVVSPAIMHKSDAGGVAVGVDSEKQLAEHFDRFSRMEQFQGMLIAGMISGVELILGGKVDRQFGPVVMLGIGGTGVEIYGDVVIRMAPLERRDVDAMARGLAGRRLLEGFRRRPPVPMDELAAAVLAFSEVMMKYREQVASADINPLICTADSCVAADARIILRSSK